MASVPDPTPYDEFALFSENAAEYGLAWDGPPAVERVYVDVGEGQKVSALVWGSEPPEVVLLHGGAQNAHTWDTVALALRRPLVAIDLPGHGRSDWRSDHDYSPATNAPAVARSVTELAPAAELVCGMSLGGLTALCLAASYPQLVRRLVVVDVAPGVDHKKAEPIIAFISGPEVFASFEEILARTIEYNPTRTESSLRRGVLHNAMARPDGTWVWRYDRMRGTRPEEDGERNIDYSALWEAVAAVKAPFMLVRGGLSGVVSDEDVAELVRRKPGVRVEVVAGAGHSIQGDRPLELARLLEDALAAAGE